MVEVGGLVLASTVVMGLRCCDSKQFFVLLATRLGWFQLRRTMCEVLVPDDLMRHLEQVFASYLRNAGI
jgi:hypothetical protein